MMTTRQINVPIPKNLQEAQKLAKESTQKLRHMRKNAEELRVNEQLQLIGAQGLEGAKRAKIIKAIHRHERLQKVYQRMKILKNKTKQQLTAITIPESDGTITTIDIPEEVEAALIERNKNHFGQAQGTPFTISPLSDDLNFSANTVSADKIVEGIYNQDLSTETEWVFCRG